MLDRLAAALQRAGASAAEAKRHAPLIGDTPEIEADQVVVRDEDGGELARYPATVLV